MVARPGAAMRAIDWIHRWTGGVIGLLLAAMGLSGTFLLHQTAFLLGTLTVWTFWFARCARHPLAAALPGRGPECPCRARPQRRAYVIRA